MVTSGSDGFAWGGGPTEFFHHLTPDVIFDSVEKLGYRCTGRCLPLNSLENRVVEVEVEPVGEINSESQRFRVAKFYRPNRWSREQILDEHQFLADLTSADIPVVGPEADANGQTLFEIEGHGIFYCLFPKAGGRNPDELNHDQLQRIGRLLARLHHVGAAAPAPHRISLNPLTYGLNSLDFLLDSESIPESMEDDYIDVVEEICDRAAPLFESVAIQRVHGDCHLGNVLWSSGGPVWVDFDDMVNAPCVQDIWLLTPGRDDDSVAARAVLLEAYESMSSFDRRSLRLIEPLRALRFIHFSAWVAKRWQDPAFPRIFTEFGTDRYWHEQITDLRECLELFSRSRNF